MERENFINEILNSVDGIAKVTPNEVLFQKIEHRIQETTVSPRTLWLVAASIAVLISLNIILLNEKSGLNQSEILILGNSINNNNQLYK